MSTPCLIGRPNGADGFKAVYCHCDGNPSTMVPVLRRMVLCTFDGSPAGAAHYLFRYSGFGYWSSLTGSGDAYCSAMRAETANDGPVHKWTGEPWPQDIDIYHGDLDRRSAVLEYRDGAYTETPVLNWGQQWLYIIYPQVLAVLRYVAPSQNIGNRTPLGIRCEPIPWLKPIGRSQLVALERRATSKLDEILALRLVPTRS